MSLTKQGLLTIRENGMQLQSTLVWVAKSLEKGVMDYTIAMGNLEAVEKALNENFSMLEELFPDELSKFKALIINLEKTLLDEDEDIQLIAETFAVFTILQQALDYLSDYISTLIKNEIGEEYETTQSATSLLGKNSPQDYDLQPKVKNVIGANSMAQPQTSQPQQKRSQREDVNLFNNTLSQTSQASTPAHQPQQGQSLNYPQPAPIPSYPVTGGQVQQPAPQPSTPSLQAQSLRESIAVEGLKKQLSPAMPTPQGERENIRLALARIMKF